MKQFVACVVGALLGASGMHATASTTAPASSVQWRLSDDPQAVLEVFDGKRFVPIGVIDRSTDTWSAGNSPELHGAEGHCVPDSNDTAAVQAFLDSVADGGSGSWNGCYNIDEGALVLTPPAHATLVSTGAFKTYAAPHIAGNAMFIARGTGSGPMLSITNPSQATGNGTFYAGGSIGNLTFIDRTRSGLTSRHGLLIQGLYDWSFGQIIGQDLAGSAVYTSKKTVNGDPDAFGSGKNAFRAIVCSRCNRPSFDAEDLGEGGESIGFIASYGNGPSSAVQSNGGMVNAGQGTSVESLSASMTRGWGVTFGGPRAHGSRQNLHGVELDATENGIWVGALLQSVISGRIIYDPVPPSKIVWPLTAIKLGGMGSQVRDVTLHFIIRIDPGTTLKNVVEAGTLIDLSKDPNLIDDEIDLTVLDNANLGIFAADRLRGAAAQLIKNVNPLAQVRVRINGQVVMDTLAKPAR